MTQAKRGGYKVERRRKADGRDPVAGALLVIGAKRGASMSLLDALRLLVAGSMEVSEGAWFLKWTGKLAQLDHYSFTN